MKKTAIYFLSIALLMGMVSCKAKKCKNFADPRNSYHVKYNKKGLVKSKNKNTSRSSWINKY